jgi:hypothetical protein
MACYVTVRREGGSALRRAFGKQSFLYAVLARVETITKASGGGLGVSMAVAVAWVQP